MDKLNEHVLALKHWNTKSDQLNEYIWTTKLDKFNEYVLALKHFFSFRYHLFCLTTTTNVT
jgi:hypothetical protein